MISPSQIRAARALIGVKQSELAKAAGISLATLNNIERSVGDPRTSTLEAIEHALAGAGVELQGDPMTESVKLRKLERPSAIDTLFASQRALELLGPKSLTRIRRVLFYVCVLPGSNGGSSPLHTHKICLLIEGTSRSVLFDRVQFSLANGARAAEVAAIMLWAFRYHGKVLCYLDQALEDTAENGLAEVVERLRGLPWRPLRQPADFVGVFDDWQDQCRRYADWVGHPMRDLAAQFRNASPEREADPAPAARRLAGSPHDLR